MSPNSTVSPNSPVPPNSAAHPLRVILAEDSVMLREGMASLLEAAGLEVVAQAGHASELIRKVVSYIPDVAIVDVRMPPTYTTEGIEAAVEIRRKSPETGVLVFSQHVEKAGLSELLEANPTSVGYLLKDRIADVDQFVVAVHAVACGESVVDPTVVAQLLGDPSARAPLDVLTEREMEALALIAEGKSNRVIAEQMVITRGAVEQYASSIFRKLEIDAESNRRVQAVLKFLECTADGRRAR